MQIVLLFKEFFLVFMANLYGYRLKVLFCTFEVPHKSSLYILWLQAHWNGSTLTRSNVLLAGFDVKPLRIERLWVRTLNFILRLCAPRFLKMLFRHLGVPSIFTWFYSYYSHMVLFSWFSGSM